MSTFSFTINGVDYTNCLVLDSVQITEAAQVRGFSMGAQIVIKNQDFATPLGGQLVKFMRDSTIEFAGRIASVKQTQRWLPTQLRYDLTCVDHSTDFDNELLSEAFPANQTAGDIVRQIVGIVGRGFTSIGVADGVVLGAVNDTKKIDLETPSAVIQKIADSIEYQWFIDYNRDVQFFILLDRIAPVAAIDADVDTVNTDKQAIYRDLFVDEQWDQVKNVVWLTGGKAKSGNNDQLAVTGDGTQKFFPLNYEPWDINNIVVTRNGVPQTLKFDGIDGQAGDGAGGASDVYVCLLPGQKVITFDGYKSVESLVIGDLVLTADARFMPVTQTFEIPYTGPIHTIVRFGHCDPIEATADHRLLVVRAQDAMVAQANNKYHSRLTCVGLGVQHHQFVRASEINPGDYLIEPVPKPLYTDLDLTEDLAWLIGLYLAEGHIDDFMSARSINPSRLVTFGLHMDELPTIGLRLCKILERDFNASPSITRNVGSKGNGAVIHAGANNPLAEFLERFGRGSHLKHLPEWLIHQSDPITRAVMYGMWEGDGCIKTNQGTVSYTSVSYSLANGFRRLLLKHGIIGSLSQEKGWTKLPNNQDFYRSRYVVNIGGVEADRFATLVGLPLWMVNPQYKRRAFMNNARIVGDYAYYRVKETAQKQFAGLVYDVEVDIDHTFTTVAIQSNCF